MREPTATEVAVAIGFSALTMRMVSSVTREFKKLSRKSKKGIDKPVGKCYNSIRKRDKGDTNHDY